MTTKNNAPFGHLCNYATGEDIRPATRDELIESLTSGDDGAFDLDGTTVYVDRLHDEMLYADDSDFDGISVLDIEGRRWRPDTEAHDEILSSEDPALCAVVMCRMQPMRGVWHS